MKLQKVCRFAILLIACAVRTGASVQVYEPYTISTLPSSAPPTAAVGVAVDSSGNVYVADDGNASILKITSAGIVITLAGGTYGSADGIGNAAQFAHPLGVAVDSSTNIYVADERNNTIRKVTPGGSVTTFAGLAGTSGSADGSGSAARFFSPQGVALDNSGNVYVADLNNHTIRKITPSAVVSTLAGLAGSGGGVDGTGSAARFRNPHGVVVDNGGNVYVADTGNNTIRKITPGRVVSTLAGLALNSGSADGTGSAAQFNLPFGVAVDGSGNVYVADTGNNTIRKITPAGVVTTLAGQAGNSGRADGTGSAALFSNSRGVAVDSVGNIYVADGVIRTGRPASPSLQIVRSANRVILSWPVSAAGFALESSTNLALKTSWSAVATGITTIGDQSLFIADVASGAKFYRLRAP